MSRRNSTAMSQGSSPRDIHGGSMPNVMVDEEIPSRSYYSSHLAIEPGGKCVWFRPSLPRLIPAAEHTTYSASIESIRAHSLALGDRYMQESSPVNSPPSHGTSPSLSNTNDALTSPISPVQPNSHSILSKLLKRDESERKPLLKHSHRKQKSYLSAHSHDSLPNMDPESAHAIPPSSNTTTTEDQQQEQDEQYAYSYGSHNNQHQHTKEFRPTWKQLKNPKIWMNCFTQPISYIPAVILGLLLNLLDAISYGMITFPLNNPIFASFGPDGISMFFVRFVVVAQCYRKKVRQCVVMIWSHYY